MRYFLGFLIAIGLIVLVFVLILKSFGGSSKKITQKPLVNYASTDTTVSMTVDGPVNADQIHQSFVITVGQNQATITIYTGYQGDIVTTKSYQNNETAFANFLRAIDLQGFTKGDTVGSKDYRGFCPLGERFVLAADNEGTNLQKFWSTSCGQGTFKGNFSTIRFLFNVQIPDFNKLTNNLQFPTL